MVCVRTDKNDDIWPTVQGWDIANSVAEMQGSSLPTQLSAPQHFYNSRLIMYVIPCESEGLILSRVVTGF
jgi:hypothetical protein